LASSRRGRGPSLNLLMDGRLLALAALATALLVAFSAYSLRMLPYYNYAKVAQIAAKYGISPNFTKYSYLNANDPWIEYWLAKYLHEHGLASWATLTRDNPATRIFWYPWGRDFTKTEYPLIPMLGSLGSDPLTSTVKLPALAGAMLVLAAFAFGTTLYGPLAGLVAALLAAFIPAAASRTFAGFVEKTGIAMPFLVVALLFYTLAIREPKRERSLIYSLVAAVFWLLLGLSWGGYGLMNMAVALTVLLTPLAVGLRSEEFHRVFYSSFVALTIFTVVGYVLASAGYGRISLTFAATTYAALLFTYIFSLYASNKLPLRVPAKYVTRPERLYLYVLVVALTVAPLASFTAGILKGKYAFTLLWPLRDLGLIQIGRIGETVAEMAGVFARGNFRDFFYQTNIVGLVSPVAALYLLYRGVRRRELHHMPVAALTLVLFYSVLGMLYLLQTFASIGLLAVAGLAGTLFEAWGREETPKARNTARRKRRRDHHGGTTEDLVKVLSLVLLVFIVIGVALAAAETRRNLSAIAATVTGGNVNRIYLSWLWTLEHLATTTPNATVVAAWWDYGYWISVGSGRPTLADGGTLNGTQIRLLATAFTGTEEEANRILHMLRLQPGQTLVLFNDYIVYDPKRGTVSYLFPQAGIDLLKSWAMHHIAARDEKFNNFIEVVNALLLNQGNRAENIRQIRDFVNTTLIYKMMIDAVHYLDTHGVVVPRELAPLLGNRTVKDVYFVGVNMPVMKMRHFKLYAVIVAPFIDSSGRPIVNPDGTILMHVITLYTWEG